MKFMFVSSEKQSGLIHKFFLNAYDLFKEVMMDPFFDDSVLLESNKRLDQMMEEIYLKYFIP
jgi:hypothetical protein